MEYKTLVVSLEDTKTSIRLEEELLNAYSLASFGALYEDRKKSVNKVIRTLVRANYKDFKNQVTQNIRRIMLEYISEHLQKTI